MATTVQYTKKFTDSLITGLTCGAPPAIITGVLLTFTKSPFWSQIIGGAAGTAFISDPAHRDIVAINSAQDAITSLFVRVGGN